ncbi:MAG: hypothetical protein IT494_09670 [Gammaproteobacteria bacterium]|nr:hypothetical protein [Gammaproteobacteria bacterium]
MNRKALMTTLALIAGSPIANAADTSAATAYELNNAPLIIAEPRTDALWQGLNAAQDTRLDATIAQTATETIAQGFANEVHTILAATHATNRTVQSQMRRNLLDEIRLEIIAGVMTDSGEMLLRVRRSIAAANPRQETERSL